MSEVNPSRLVVKGDHGEQKQPEMQGPKCPHCGTKPARLKASQTQFADMLAVVFSCFNCDKIISIAPLGIARPQRPESGLILPLM